MGLETGFYGNLKPVQVDLPDPVGAMGRAMALGELGMKARAAQRDMQDQDALRSAIKNNTRGNAVDWQGAIGELGQTAPTQMLALQSKVAEMNKQAMEARTAQMTDKLQRAQIYGNGLQSLAGMSPEARAAAWPEFRNTMLQQQVMDQTQLPEQYDDKDYTSHLGRYHQSKDWIDAQLKQAETAKNRAATDKDIAETGKVRAETPKTIDLTNIDPNTPPSKVVAAVVPLQQQPEAFKQLDRVTNTAKARQTILNAFDAAADDYEGLGKVKGAVRDSRHVNALQGNLMVTLQDLEGSVKEAAAESIRHNYTPLWNETKAEKDIKRQALVDYLDSKESSSILSARGVDLSKFNATKNVDPRDNKTDLAGMAKTIAKGGKSDKGGPSLESEAAAAEKTPAQDTQIATWATQHNIPYSQAAAIIAGRRKNAGN